MGITVSAYLCYGFALPKAIWYENAETVEEINWTSAYQRLEADGNLRLVCEKMHHVELLSPTWPECTASYILAATEYIRIVDAGGIIPAQMHVADPDAVEQRLRGFAGMVGITIGVDTIPTWWLSATYLY